MTHTLRPHLLALLTVAAAGCTEPSPLADFQRDNPHDAGGSTYQLAPIDPPVGLTIASVNDGTFGILWQSVSQRTERVVVERKRNDEAYVVVGEVEKDVRLLPVPIPGPGLYSFRAASRAADGALGLYAYTGTVTVR